MDSSVLARAYLQDEFGHEAARALVEGSAFLVTSTLTLVDVTSALFRATHAGRVADVDTSLAKLDDETAPDGPITLIRADQLTAETVARQLVREHTLRALDALHLAVAELSARPLAGDGEEVAFASRDDAQRAAAVALGFVAV
ncbi:MAG: type II toxin-antitoxin system VapC family toxin [Jiangellaceae bacterium]